MKEYTRTTWHVYDDCTLKVFEGHREILAFEMTPDQAIRMAADLIIKAQRIRKGAQNVDSRANDLHVADGDIM